MYTLLLYFLAFCSGFAALIYQVAWSRMLSLTVGSSTLAISAVVAGFMGGMGIGAWLYHRVGDRVRAPLNMYAFLEFGIALSTAIFTLLFIPLPEIFGSVAQHLPAGFVMDCFRVAIAFGLIVLPACLMGATYPALCQALMHSAEEVEGRLGWIYGLNTVGAAAGAFAAGFFLIELAGSHGSVVIANGINVFVGACALLMARAARRTGASVGSAETSDESLTSALPYWLIGVVLFGSGFATIGYEIVWFRALHYIMGNGTYVLSTALVIFLLGLGFGGLFYRVAVRFGKPEWNLGLCQLAIAALALIAIGAEQWLLIDPEINSRISGFSTEALSQSWQWRVGVGFLTALAIMLPATLWMGLSFPLASRLFLGSVRTLSSRVGLAYLLSNLGSISGALFAAMWILPNLGTVGGTKFLVVVNVLLGLLILQRCPSNALRGVTGMGVAVVIALALALPPRLAFQREITPEMQGSVGLLFEKESDLGTVQVFSRRGVRDANAMAIDGIVIAATESWAPGLYVKQLVLAHLPMNLDRNIRRTLNLGVASGSTLKTLSKYDWIETLDAVEINPAVIDAGEFFFETTVFRDPRTNLYVEDAVNYLLRTPKTYDLIISDAKQDPRFGGNAKVLSKELYEYSLARLSECGLFVQFLPVLSGSPESMELILRTFMAVFPEVEFYMDTPFYVLSIGSRCPIGGRERPTREELLESGVAMEIERNFVPDASGLGGLWVSSGDEIAASLGEGAINSWDRLPLEFLSYRLPTRHPKRAAAILDMVFAPRDQAVPGPAVYTSEPYFEPLIDIMTAYREWIDFDVNAARRRIDRIARENPDLALAERAKPMIYSNIELDTEEDDPDESR